MPIAELLEKVSGADKNDPATVKVTLRNGLAFNGAITSYDSAKGVCTIIDQQGTPSILSVGDVVSVTILNAGGARVALQGGKLYPTASEEVPSFLALRRNAETLSNKFKVKVTLNFAEEDVKSRESRYALKQVLSALESALSGITSDSTGRAALNAYSEGVSVESGSTMRVDGASKTKLVLTLSLAEPLRADFSAEIAEGLNNAL